MMVWSQLYQTYGGMLSAETAMENSGIENPQEEMLKASVNLLFMSEPAQQVRTMMMLKGLQGQASEVLQAFQQGMANQPSALPPQGMMDPQGNMGVAMDSLPSATGMPEQLDLDRQVNMANEMR